VLRFGFEEMALNRVEALILPGNEAAHRLLTGLAFQREGVLREYEHLKGQFVDLTMYSLLRRDSGFQTSDDT
jgi:ribosomal-protein-alanine N-acetyltransferase